MILYYKLSFSVDRFTYRVSDVYEFWNFTICRAVKTAEDTAPGAFTVGFPVEILISFGESSANFKRFFGRKRRRARFRPARS